MKLPWINFADDLPRTDAYSRERDPELGYPKWTESVGKHFCPRVPGRTRRRAVLLMAPFVPRTAPGRAGPQRLPTKPFPPHPEERSRRNREDAPYNNNLSTRPEQPIPLPAREPSNRFNMTGQCSKRRAWTRSLKAPLGRHFHRRRDRKPQVAGCWNSRVVVGNGGGSGCSHSLIRRPAAVPGVSPPVHALTGLHPGRRAHLGISAPLDVAAVVETQFRQTALFCTLGYATHALLDAATSYGTHAALAIQAMNAVCVEDCFRCRSPVLAAGHRACRAVGTETQAGVCTAGPGVGRGLIWLWARCSMRPPGRWAAPLRKPEGTRPSAWRSNQVSATLWSGSPSMRQRAGTMSMRCGLVLHRGSSPGHHAPKHRPCAGPRPGCNPDHSRHWTSSAFAGSAMICLSPDPAQSDVIIDVRYSLIPNEVAALWSIEVDRNAAQTDHVRFHTHRENASRRMGELWEMIVWRRHPLEPSHLSLIIFCIKPS